jgi:hypothetical protein
MFLSLCYPFDGFIYRHVFAYLVPNFVALACRAKAVAAALTVRLGETSAFEALSHLSIFTTNTHTKCFAVDSQPRLDAPLRNTRRGVVFSCH